MSLDKQKTKQRQNEDKNSEEIVYGQKLQESNKYDIGQDSMHNWFRMKFFDDLSDIRPEVRGYYKHYVHNFVTTFFSKDKVAGKKILDFGCGPGFYSSILAQQGAEVIGIDISQFLIDKANENKARLNLSNIKFIQSDFIIYSPRWKAGIFDYVIAIDTVVSFDYGKSKHSHDKVVAAFKSICRLLKEDGRFFIIESHPFFGRISKEIAAGNGEYFYMRPSDYKIDYKFNGFPHHWFTLDEMSSAINESGLAISRIYEPDPGVALKHDSVESYSFRMKYPGMIVYELIKVI